MTTDVNCRKPGYPNFTPYISQLSTTTSKTGIYTNVTIYGYNFLPFQKTYVQFGSLGKVDVLFNSYTNISFIVPTTALPGSYTIQVINIYNNNFSPCINMSYPSSFVYSNEVEYIVTL